MKSYLAQIVRASGVGAAPALRPFIRSRSPIAESDQRLGLSDWEVPISAENETVNPDAGSATGANVANAGLPKTSLEFPAVEPEPSSDALASSGRPIPAAPDEQEPRPLSPNPQKSPVRSSLQPREGLKREGTPDETEPPPTRPLGAVGGNAVAERKASAARTQSPATPSAVRPPSSHEPRTLEQSELGSNQLPRQNVEGKLRQPPPATAVVSQEERQTSQSAAAETSVAKRQEEKAPPRVSMPTAVAPPDSPPAQVIIDRLEIEVVPAPPPDPKPARAEQGSGATRPQRPASKIGPLSQNAAFRHYLSLRYR